MAVEKVCFPIPPWAKALLNAVIVSSITSLSMLATGDFANPHLLHSMLIAGGMSLLIQLRSLFEKDLADDDSGIMYHPLDFTSSLKKKISQKR